MSDLPYDRENFCYRHPDRQSFILCQRCGRTVCPQCATQASVGVHCPECMKEAKANAPRRRPALRAVRSIGSPISGTPIVTYAIMAICVLVFLAQQIPGSYVTSLTVYAPALTFSQPWRLVTSLVAHGSIIHILANMYSLFVIGRMLEPTLGRGRYLALFLIGGLGGSVAVLLLAPTSYVLGASGAIFAMLGALVVLVRRIGGNTTQLYIVIAINLAIGFLVSGISWQAHVGGLVVGLAFAAIYVRTRGPRNRLWQALLIGALPVALLAISAAALAIG